MTLAQQLAQGVLQLGFTLPEGAQQRLLEYLALLQKWNRVYNLTAVREAPRMVSQHLLDCLAAAPHIGAVTLLDVGSGAGLPGIPLALALPDSRVTLLDSNHKKAAFLKQAVMELKLVNAVVVCERAETWSSSTTFEVVISRAFSDLAEFVSVAGRHAAAGGRLVAMKGVHPYEEIAQLPPGWQVRQVMPLTVNGR
jgi:16S rRNA (guanine527-N7)-methyltransferase